MEKYERKKSEASEKSLKKDAGSRQGHEDVLAEVKQEGEARNIEQNEGDDFFDIGGVWGG